MSRVDDLLKKYSNYNPPASNLVQTEKYNVNRTSNTFDRYNVNPQYQSDFNNAGRYGSNDILDRANNFSDIQTNRVSTQNLNFGNSRPNIPATNPGPDYTFKKTDSLHMGSTTKPGVDGFVQIVAMGAEMERLNQKIKFQQNQPLPQVSSHNDDELLRENQHLKNQISGQENDYLNLEEENYRLKEREKQLKDRMGELNDENKRLMAMQVEKGKGGAWCC